MNKIYSKVLCKSIGCNHIHPLDQRDIEEIFRAIFSTPKSSGNYCIDIDAVGDYTLSLVPRSAITNKKALFWAYRGERRWASLCVREKFVDASKLEPANKIKVVFKRKKHDAFLITAFPVAEGGVEAPALEPGNYLRKKGGTCSYKEQEFADLCEFWSNYVLVMEKGETYTPAPTPRWYQRYWRLKYRPS